MSNDEHPADPQEGLSQDLADSDIERVLKEVVDAADSPRRLAAMDIFSWSRLDAEIAELIADSRGTEELAAAAMRSIPEASAFQLTFSFSGHAITADIEVTGPGESTVVVLLDDGSGFDEIAVSLADGSVTVQRVENGSAVVRGVRRPGPIRIGARREQQTVAVSPWFSI